MVSLQWGTAIGYDILLFDKKGDSEGMMRREGRGWRQHD
jgi:hypothetical protein